MSSFFTIQLLNLRFFAGHGLYNGEDAWGNEFEVNIRLLLLPINEKKELQLNDTIDYAKAYQIIDSQFANKTELLENLAIKIADELENVFPFIQEINISIDKLTPPIPGFKGSVGISYNRNKDGTIKD